MTSTHYTHLSRSSVDTAIDRARFINCDCDLGGPPCHLIDAAAVDVDDDDGIDDAGVIGADAPSDIAAQFNGRAPLNYA